MRKKLMNSKVYIAKENNGYTFIWRDGEGSYYIGIDGMDIFYSNSFNPYDKYTYSEATENDKMWLEACIKKGELVTNPNGNNAEIFN